MTVVAGTGGVAIAIFAVDELLTVWERFTATSGMPTSNEFSSVV